MAALSPPSLADSRSPPPPDRHSRASRRHRLVARRANTAGSHRSPRLLLRRAYLCRRGRPRRRRPNRPGSHPFNPPSNHRPNRLSSRPSNPPRSNLLNRFNSSRSGRYRRSRSSSPRLGRPNRRHDQGDDRRSNGHRLNVHRPNRPDRPRAKPGLLAPRRRRRLLLLCRRRAPVTSRGRQLHRLPALPPGRKPRGPRGRVPSRRDAPRRHPPLVPRCPRPGPRSVRR